MEKQFVYIFSNSQQPTLIKIGRTDKNPFVRAEQLSRQTGTIGTYEVEWHKEVSDSQLAESFLHFTFKRFHHQKEYFKIDKKVAVKIAESAIKEFLELLEKFDFYPLEQMESGIGGYNLLIELAESIEEKKLLTSQLEILEMKLKTLKGK